jgi:hypothetical protein
MRRFSEIRRMFEKGATSSNNGATTSSNQRNNARKDKEKEKEKVPGKDEQKEELEKKVEAVALVAPISDPTQSEAEKLSVADANPVPPANIEHSNIINEEKASEAKLETPEPISSIDKKSALEEPKSEALVTIEVISEPQVQQGQEEIKTQNATEQKTSELLADTSMPPVVSAAEAHKEEKPGEVVKEDEKVEQPHSALRRSSIVPRTESKRKSVSFVESPVVTEFVENQHPVDDEAAVKELTIEAANAKDEAAENVAPTPQAEPKPAVVNMPPVHLPIPIKLRKQQLAAATKQLNNKCRSKKKPCKLLKSVAVQVCKRKHVKIGCRTQP